MLGETTAILVLVVVTIMVVVVVVVVAEKMRLPENNHNGTHRDKGLSNTSLEGIFENEY